MIFYIHYLIYSYRYRPLYVPLGVSVESSVTQARGNKAKRKQNKGHTTNKTKTKEARTDEATSAVGGKDSSLLIFRALGKVLYCKREY